MKIKFIFFFLIVISSVFAYVSEATKIETIKKNFKSNCWNEGHDLKEWRKIGYYFEKVEDVRGPLKKYCNCVYDDFDKELLLRIYEMNYEKQEHESILEIQNKLKNEQQTKSKKCMNKYFKKYK